MNEVNENLKKRDEFTKYLEYSFITDAAEVFLRNHSKAAIDSRLVDEDSLKYSAFATRIWLNYLDKDQFERILKKRLRTDNPLNDNIDITS